MKKRNFGELELSVLTIIRKIKQATVRDVYDALGQSGSYTTIMTVMSRLAEKGELTREKKGKQYLYWIQAKNEKGAKNILRRIQEKIFGGRPAAMVSYLLESEEKLTDQELRELEEFIQKRRAEKQNG